LVSEILKRKKMNNLKGLMLIAFGILLILSVSKVNCQRQLEVLEQQLIQAFLERPEGRVGITQGIRGLPLRTQLTLFRLFPNLSMILMPD
jgi:hypothetical protein